MLKGSAKKKMWIVLCYKNPSIFPTLKMNCIINSFKKCQQHAEGATIYFKCFYFTSN